MNITKVETTGMIRAWVTDSADQTETAPNATVLTKLFDTLTNGTGSDQANDIYAVDGTLTSGSTDTYDLAGSLTNVFGETITFTLIKGIILKNTSTTASVLAVGGGTDGAGTNAFDTWITAGTPDGSEQVFVRPGGVFLLYTPDSTGYAVTATTADILGVEETSSLAASYSLAVLGVV